MKLVEVVDVLLSQDTYHGRGGVATAAHVRLLLLLLDLTLAHLRRAGPAAVPEQDTKVSLRRLASEHEASGVNAPVGRGGWGRDIAGGRVHLPAFLKGSVTSGIHSDLRRQGQSVRTRGQEGAESSSLSLSVRTCGWEGAESNVLEREDMQRGRGGV